ncbi:hypothetical protein LIER_36666 [Lithospermum erythrorhizon]|uniref:Uncharacterized protein n=1 Tax=Lithospermum erythrorhizon TaxID=34254 RepID=A0AAV3P9S9_LITER
MISVVAELPGFYYDEEKNRYFPIKGSMPGSSRKRKPSPHPPAPKTTQLSGSFRRQSIRNNELLQVREVCGNVIASRKGKINFQMEYEKRRASQPLIWKYHGTERTFDQALDQAKIDIYTSDGITTSNIMVAGGSYGSLSFYETRRVIQEPDYLVYYTPDLTWPLVAREQIDLVGLPRDLGRCPLETLNMRSDISCIKTLPKHSVSDTNFLITTLDGSVYNLRLRGHVNYSSGEWTQMDKVTSLNRTIWTADCNSDGSRAIIGTNLGAYVVNTETRTGEYLCRCESDVLSVQVDLSGNVILCGLRNGAILTLDIRQKPRGHTAKLTRHKVSYPLPKQAHRPVGNFSKQWFEVKGNIVQRHTVFLPSSVSCLASLKLYDQYFCASSMDGSVSNSL